MRMGAFLVGGLVGIGAVMAWNRRGRHMNMNMNFSALTNRAMRMMNRAKDKGQEAVNSATNVKDKLDFGFGIDELKEIIYRDPKVKQQVQEILDHHGASIEKRSHALTQ